MANVEDSPLGRVVRIARKSDALSVFSAVPTAFSYRSCWPPWNSRRFQCPGKELLELAASVVTSLADDARADAVDCARGADARAHRAAR